MIVKLEEIISILYLIAGLIALQNEWRGIGIFLVGYSFVNLVYCIYLSAKEEHAKSGL
jgi:hypothetical protein